MTAQGAGRLWEVAPALLALLEEVAREKGAAASADIGIETVFVRMRDGVRLATDIYRSCKVPAPVVILRTPYGRDGASAAGTCAALARRGYVAVAQDCRGTGASEPEHWDYYVREPEDSFDLIDWVARQPWCNGFIGACGSSYVAQTQWCMAVHPRMGAIVPEVSGLGVAHNSTRLHMFLNAYARSVGKGRDKLAVGYDELERRMLGETLAGGFCNEPLYRPFPPSLVARHPSLATLTPAEGRRYLWSIYCGASCEERAGMIKLALGSDTVSIAGMESLPSVFGQDISHDAHTLPSPDVASRCRSVHAPALMVTGWYDWGLNDALATFAALTREGNARVASTTRLLVTPSAHNTPGYREGADSNPALRCTYRTSKIVPLIDAWCRAVADDVVADWPRVVYYLMGADEWRAASAWPPPQMRLQPLYLAAHGRLRESPPADGPAWDRYTYRPHAPTPTLGGSIVSYVYPPGSVDVSSVQARPDVLVYTLGPLEADLDVVGPLKMVLYASSSAVDTDFSVRLTDVFPDGRAIQIQSGILRARFRDSMTEPSLLEPGKTYRFEIDMWATANRFRAGHSLRIDIASADFPRFDRHANRADGRDPPLDAVQTIYRDAEHPSHVLLPVVR